MIQFTNKIITVQSQSIPTTISSPISKRINPDLWLCFSNLNFAGVYRIGSETDNRSCYIGSSYNITLKITHHLNLLLSGKHHSVGLQEWFNENGVDKVDVSILRRTSSNPDEFENWEQYYLNLIKPKFNSVLNKKVINPEILQVKRNVNYTALTLNEFGNQIVSKLNVGTTHMEINFRSTGVIDDERKAWKPSYVFIEGDEITRIRGDRSDVPKVKKFVSDKEITEITTVRRNLGFIGR